VCSAGTTFWNLSSLVNASIALPDPGAGLRTGGYVNDQIYELGLISDANGSLTVPFFSPVAPSS